ncbi:MAG: PIN domain-containing protein [Berryella intestinalis]|nr:PIN domain-containing protein [Berryella intestinalis]
MSERLFLLDTNVWLDYFLGFRPQSKAAVDFINIAIERGVRFCHAVHATKDLFYLVSADYRRAVMRDKGEVSKADAATAAKTAWMCLSKMDELSTAVGCDRSDVWIAQKQRCLHGDYEDSLVIAAALRCNADLLITNDEELIRHCPVAALSVEDATNMLCEERGLREPLS